MGAGRTRQHQPADRRRHHGGTLHGRGWRRGFQHSWQRPPKWKALHSPPLPAWPSRRRPQARTARSHPLPPQRARQRLSAWRKAPCHRFRPSGRLPRMPLQLRLMPTVIEPTLQLHLRQIPAVLRPPIRAWRWQTWRRYSLPATLELPSLPVDVCSRCRWMPLPVRSRSTSNRLHPIRCRPALRYTRQGGALLVRCREQVSVAMIALATRELVYRVLPAYLMIVCVLLKTFPGKFAIYALSFPRVEEAGLVARPGTWQTPPGPARGNPAPSLP